MDLNQIKKCKRIIIIGSSSSGKSTLAHQLSEKLNIPAHHLDAYAHKPNSKWERTPIEEFYEAHDSILKNDKWIIEGNYSKTFEKRIKKSDLVIYLKTNRFASIYKYIDRCFAKRNRHGMPSGCQDQLTFKMIKYLLITFPKKYKKYIWLLKNHDNTIIISSFKNLLKFKKELGLETEKI